MSNAVRFLQGTSSAASTLNGNGSPEDSSGFLGAQIVEIVESGGGTCTVTLEGSFDGANWYAAGYQQTDAAASLTRAVTGISVLANSKHVYQLLDPYPQIRARQSATAGGGAIVAKLYEVS